jgi:parallel beta-helix repeat protein
MKMVGDNTSHIPVAEVHVWENYQILKGSGAEETKEESHQIFSADIESKVGTTTTDETYIIYSDDFDASGVYQKIVSPNITIHRQIEVGGVDKTLYTYIELKWLKNRDLYIDHLWVRDIYNYRMVEAPDSTTWYNKILDYLRPIHNYNPSNNFSWYSDEPNPIMYDSYNKVDDLSRNDPTIGIPLNGATGGGDYEKFGAFISKIQPDELIANRYTITGEHSSSSDVANSIQNAFDVYTDNIGDAALACKQYDVDLWPMIQVQSEYRYYEDSDEWRWSYRDPSKNEIKAEVNLSLCYGAKAISYFVYGTGNFGWGTWYYHGLVDNVGGSPVYDPTSGDYLPSLYDYTTGVYEPNEKWYAVQEAHEIIDLIADDLLSLDWQNAFTYPDDQIPPGGSAVLSVENTSGLNEYVEIGNFVHSVTGDKYFMLVNRRVQDDNPNDTQTLTVKLESSGVTRLIEDVLASRQPWDGDQNRLAYRVLNSGENTFTIALEPGEGRLFRISSGLSGTISMDSYWPGDILIADNITVNDNISLTIYPGTTIKFDSGKKLTINGALDAQGTADNRIVFTSTSGTWDGISLINADNSSTLEYCEIKYADKGIRCVGALPTISHNLISNNSIGIYLTEIGTTTKSVCYNEIKDNSTYGIYLNNSSNFIGSNIIQNNGPYGICCYRSSPSIYGNTITDHSSAGIYCNYYSPVYLSYYSTGPGGNLITENYRGIYANYQCNAFIYWNDIYSNTSYELEGYQPLYIDAEYNWWGSNPPNSNEIHASNGASIDYDPWLSGQVTEGLGKGVASSSESDIDLAWQYQLAEEYDKAITLYRKVVKENISNEKGWYSLVRLGECHSRAGKDGFISFLNSTVRPIISRDTDVYRLTLELESNWWYTVGKYQLALNTLEQIKKDFTNNSEMYKYALFNSGYIHRVFLDNQSEAEKAFSELEEKYPQDPLVQDTKILMDEEVDNLLPKRSAPPEEYSAYSLPVKFVLHDNYPNPFNPRTTIAFDLPEESHVTLIIYDISGREVVRLVDGNLHEGFRHAVWDGRDKSGIQVSSGVYLYSIRTSSGFNATKKMVLVR